MVAGTKLADPKVRLALWSGGKKAILASKDPLIVYARKIDANARAIDKQYDALVDAPITAAQAKLAEARFAAYGDSNYPDATFTLRISYGRVLGWIERGSMRAKSPSSSSPDTMSAASIGRRRSSPNAALRCCWTVSA